MNTQFNSNVIWLQLEYKISTVGFIPIIWIILQGCDVYLYAQQHNKIFQKHKWEHIMLGI